MHRHIVGRQAVASGAAIEFAEIDVEVFRFGAPIAGQPELDAAARGPAGTGVAGAGKARRRGADVANGEAAGEIGQRGLQANVRQWQGASVPALPETLLAMSLDPPYLSSKRARGILHNLAAQERRRCNSPPIARDELPSLVRPRVRGAKLTAGRARRTDSSTRSR